MLIFDFTNCACRVGDIDTISYNVRYVKKQFLANLETTRLVTSMNMNSVQTTVGFVIFELV